MPTAAPGRRASTRIPGAVGGLGAAAVATVLVAFAGLVSSGPAAAWGAVVGGLLVVGVLGVGALALAVVAAYAPPASLLLALLTYTLQIVLLGLAFQVLAGSGATERALDARWLAGAVSIGTVVWVVALVVGHVRARLPVYDLHEPPHHHGPADPRETGR